MARVDCSGVTFGSYLDEKHMFEWGSEIRGFVEWDRDTLVLRSVRISDEALRDLIALLWRYKVPMKQLAQFESPRNVTWFRSPKTYWHKKVFG